MKKIAITGGKGGTGKTLMATNIAVKLHQEGYKVLLIDCDTENPNSNILLGKSLEDEDILVESVNIFKPEFDEKKCTQCGKCQKACYRHAILQFPNSYPSLMEHMCSGCQTCRKICPTNAITEGTRSIGKKYFIKNLYNTKNSLDLIIGELKEGEAASVLIVENILKMAAELNKSLPKEKKYDYFVIDTSPGAHCDVEHGLANSDIILAVTEPTPFGEHDLKRILELIKIIKKKAFVLINRSNLTEYKKEIYSLVKSFGSKIIGEIPLSDIIIEDYAKGIPFISDEREFGAKDNFNTIYKQLLDFIQEGSL